MIQVPEQYPYVIENAEVPIPASCSDSSPQLIRTDWYVTGASDERNFILIGFIFFRGSMYFFDGTIKHGSVRVITPINLNESISIKDWDCSDGSMRHHVREMQREVSKLRQLAQNMEDSAYSLAEGEDVDFSHVSQNKALFAVQAYEKHQYGVVLCRRINHAKTVWAGRDIERQFYISGGWDIPVS